MAQDRDTEDAQSTGKKTVALQPSPSIAGIDHPDDFEPDPPWDLISADPPDLIALAAEPSPQTAEEADAELRAIERRRTWPFGAAADELAHAAVRCGPSHVWWLRLLRAGELPGPQPWHEPILTDDLKMDWILAGAAPKGVSDHALDIRFGRTVRDLCPGAERFRAWRPDAARPWAFRLPPLDECRERFRRATLAKSRRRQGLVQDEPVLRALPRL